MGFWEDRRQAGELPLQTRLSVSEVNTAPFNCIRFVIDYRSNWTGCEWCFYVDYGTTLYTHLP